jgi:hypothetical protein
LIYKWYDEEDDKYYYDYHLWTYDSFSQNKWIELCNMCEWLYDDDKWEFVCDKVSNDYKEIQATIREYMQKNNTENPEPNKPPPQWYPDNRTSSYCCGAKRGSNCK